MCSLNVAKVQKNNEIRKFFPKKFGDIFKDNQLRTEVLRIRWRVGRRKGGDEGRDEGGDKFPGLPINRGFVRVKGGDEGFFQ